MIPINFRKDLARSDIPHATEYLDRPGGVRTCRNFIGSYNKSLNFENLGLGM